VALLDEPKKLPSNPYLLILIGETKGSTGNVTTSATAASNKYKNLAPEEREVSPPPAISIPARADNLHSSATTMKRTRTNPRTRRPTSDGYSRTRHWKSEKQTMPDAC
jgi:hypothetical protein